MLVVLLLVLWLCVGGTAVFVLLVLVVGAGCWCCVGVGEAVGIFVEFRCWRLSSLNTILCRS